MTSETQDNKFRILTMENLNPRVIDVKYAIRGPIAIRAAEIEQKLKEVTH